MAATCYIPRVYYPYKVGLAMQGETAPCIFPVPFLWNAIPTIAPSISPNCSQHTSAYGADAH